MKRINYLLWLMLLAVMSVGCSEDFDTPPMVVPTASHTPNMTIAEFKAKYWNSARNFIDTCKEDIVIHGYVSANDASGNLYKKMFIQDETGGFGISLDANSLNTTYRVGQEIVLNMKDRWVGKYNGEYLIGLPEWYAAQSVWEAGRMPLEVFQEFCELNGLPNPEKVSPVKVKISDFQGKSDAETQLKYNGQLVRVQNVKWEAADGVTTYSEADATTTRVLVDGDGNQLDAYNSNYADFRAEILPMGTGDVVGILYMSGADKWRLLLRDTNDCIDFENDTKGTEVNPYSVAEAIEKQNSGRSGWVLGYIVGAVAPEVTAISGNADIEWQAPTTLDNTLVIADSPETKDIASCLVISLPQSTAFRTKANLRDNPEAYKTQIYIKGELAPYMGAAGITGNSGSTDEFKMTIATGGLSTLDEGFEGGAIPSDWKNVQVAGNKAWYTPQFDNNYYAAMTGYKGTPPFDSWLISPAIDINKAESKILNFRTQVNGYGSTTTVLEVYLMSTDDPTTAVKTKLNPTLATAPASGYSSFVNSGDLDLSAYAGTYYIGFRYYATNDANYATWCVDDVKFNAGSGGGGGGDTPEPEPTMDNRADLETMNGGSPKSTYGELTSTRGWKAVNSNLLVGGDQDSNPMFKFIGFMTGSDTQYAMAVNLTGKISAPGTMTSPVLTGGLKKVTFNYAMPYTDTALKFRLDVVQSNGGVKQTWTIEETNPEKYKVYTFEGTCDITGDYQLLFYNLSPSGLDSNKDRVAIWNIVWEK